MLARDEPPRQAPRSSIVLVLGLTLVAPQGTTPDSVPRLSIRGGPHAPLARGGSQQIAVGLACYLSSLGGEIVTGHTVASINDLPPARAILFDVTPRQLLRIAGHRFSARYRRQLAPVAR